MTLMSISQFNNKAVRVASNQKPKPSALCLMAVQVKDCQDKWRFSILNGIAVAIAMAGVMEAKRKGLSVDGNDTVTKLRLEGFRELMREIHLDHAKRIKRGDILPGYDELCQAVQDYLPYLIPETEQLNLDYETANLDPAFSV